MGAGECAAGYVNCVNGNTMIADGSTTNCEAACESNCCVGTDSCAFTTAKICKDGSCTGSKACYGAGGGQGSGIERMVNSCKGDDACNSVGSSGGTVVSIENSCEGVEACAYTGSHEGKVGFILDSCVGVKACFAVGYQNGIVAYIEGSCNGLYACKQLAIYDKEAGFIFGSCNAESACSYGSSNIGNRTMSCNGFEACFALSFDSITMNLMTCCNAERECKGATESDLPGACSSGMTTPVSGTRLPTLLVYS